MADWFDDNAPKSGGDWFSQNDPAQAAPSLATQVITPKMGLGEMLFDPETAQNLRGAVQDVVYSLPGMVAQIPKMAYEGLKFATGGPQERAQVGTEALAGAVAQGQQMAADVLSPLGSRESFRGIANLGLMAAPAVGEALGEAALLGRTKPPIQGEALPQIPETPISDTVKPQTQILGGIENAQQINETTRPNGDVQLPRGEITRETDGGQVPTPISGEGVQAGGQGETLQQTPKEVTPSPAAGLSRQQIETQLEQESRAYDKSVDQWVKRGAKIENIGEPKPELPPLLKHYNDYMQEHGGKTIPEVSYHEDYLKQATTTPQEITAEAPTTVGETTATRQAAPVEPPQWNIAGRKGETATSWDTEGASIQVESRKKGVGTGGKRYVATVGDEQYGALNLDSAKAWAESKLKEQSSPVSEGGAGTQYPVSKESGVETPPTVSETTTVGQARSVTEAPTTAAPPEGEVPPVSTKNEYTDAQRVARGLPEAKQAAKRDFGTVWDEAAAQAEKDPSIGRRLVNELNTKPREVSDTENAHLLRTEIAAQTEHSAAIEAVNSAKTPEDLTAAKSRLELARQDLQDVYDATKRAGTKSGQALASRQMLAKEDYTLAAMEARRRAANDGAPLNEKQLSEVNALHEKIADLQSKLDAHEVAQKFNTEFSRLVNETRKEARASRATTKFNDFMERKANEARARIVERRVRLTTGFDPIMIADEAIVGASHIAKGITKFADWSGKMVDEFGDAVRPFLKDIWDKARTFHSEAGKEYGEKALARYKTYLGKQTEQIKGKLEAGDFTKAERQRTKLDAEAFTMRANLQKLKNQFERGVAKEAYQKKSPAQKFWDHFVGVERAMKLSGPEVFGKLGVAAFTRELLAPVESAGGYVTSKLFPRLAAGTKYGADLPTVIRAEIKAKAAMFTKGIVDAAQNIKGKETELDAISGSKIRPDFWYNRIGQMHAAIKAPVKRAEFTRSLEQRMNAAVKAGEDIHHPEVMTRLANESVMDANRAIFQQKTVVSSFFSMLDKQVPVAGRTARFLFPVVKIPVNLFKELVTYHVGAPVAATKIGMAYWKGVETLPPIQREAIIRQFTKGSVGGAALLWGYFNSDKVRKFFDNAPQWFGHTPMAMVLNEGSYLKKLQGTAPEKKEGTKELAYMAKTDIPFMYSVKSVTDALDSHNSHALTGWINNMVQSSTVPQLSTQVAKTLDKPGSFPSNLSQRANYRVANNPIEAVKLGIPGKYGRESVPMKATKAKNTTGRGTYGY